jgi:hypothetical protein
VRGSDQACYALTLKAPSLPPVPVPLRPPHADVQLDLQGLLHRIYDAAGYEDYIYRGQPQPHLSTEDATWARQFVPGGEGQAGSGSV